MTSCPSNQPTRGNQTAEMTLVFDRPVDKLNANQKFDFFDLPTRRNNELQRVLAIGDKTDIFNLDKLHAVKKINDEYNNFLVNSARNQYGFVGDNIMNICNLDDKKITRLCVNEKIDLGGKKQYDEIYKNRQAYAKMVGASNKCDELNQNYTNWYNAMNRTNYDTPNSDSGYDYGMKLIKDTYVKRFNALKCSPNNAISVDPLYTCDELTTRYDNVRRAYDDAWSQYNDRCTKNPDKQNFDRTYITKVQNLNANYSGIVTKNLTQNICDIRNNVPPYRP